MHKVLIMGGGKIGSLIAFLLAYSNKYTVFLGDIQKDPVCTQKLGQLPNFTYLQLDAHDHDAISAVIKQHSIEAIISSLPFSSTLAIAKVAAANKIHYFDLTEDVKTTDAIQEMAKNADSAFVPQCGLAPGFISIITHHITNRFESLDTVKMRVGALPTNISNVLQYALTWSTDGLINEYGNDCQAIENNKAVTLPPLEGMEKINIDGLDYEAFNTSGGIGSLGDSYHQKVKNLSYKTIRYPGHCEKIKFLMNDLKLNDDRDTLKKIFEKAIPKTFQDVVLVYVSVSGIQDNCYIEENYVNKFYPKNIGGIQWSAIQLTTASSLCTIVDLVFSDKNKYRGFIRQEEFTFTDFSKNTFGEYYAAHH
jgi:saccharopine dehydrogenase-like NADP-dependent oxidoreductase